MFAAQHEPLIFHQDVGRIFTTMRNILVTSVVMVGLWVIDAWAFEGRYRSAVWQHAASHGAMFQSQVPLRLKEAGLIRAAPC